MDPELLERITARRAELDELEEQLVKQLAEVRADRDELAVAERVLERMSEQVADGRASAAPAPGQVGGRAVMLIPHRTPDMDETMLPPDYQRILGVVRQAAGPVMARQLGDALGIDVSVRSKLEPLRGKLVRLVDCGRLRKLPDGRFTTRLCPAPPPGTVRRGRNRGVAGGRWNCVTKTKKHAEDPCPLVYQCRLPLSTRTVNHLAGLLRRHLEVIGSRWWILPPGKIAVIVLAVLRHDQRLADMAGGNNVSESTVRRWRNELIALLAAQAPRLDRTPKKVVRQGGEVVLIDGTLIATQRRTGKADRRNYSGKHQRQGLHFLALTNEKGRLIWISAARPGRTHDNTAARHDRILAHLRAAGLGALADLGFRGLGNDVLDPVIVIGFHASRTHKLTPGQKTANHVLAVGAPPSNTASPTSRTGGPSPTSAPAPPTPPTSCAPCSS
ncbi:transposase family protein [Streptomyces eurythermus]|uniref:transposase family protein n=1 Tax=Streptomyces eurythermus TaxID=42237 RepID=UPI0036D387BC